MKKIGFVVPVFNSEHTLVELHERIKKTAESIHATYHVTFINDASSDGSWEVLQKIKKDDSENTTVIKLSRNCGQHNAIFCGLHHCTGEYIITLDDDLQTPPEESLKLLNSISEKDYEVVYGVYSSKKHSAFRNFGSFLIQRIFSIVFKANGNISPFRIFTGKLKNRILQYKTSFTFVDGFIHWETIRIGRVEVEHQKRSQGKSGYTWMKLIGLTTNLVFNFTTMPLSFIIYLGILCSSVSFGLGILFIIRKLYYDVPMGYTSIIVSLFFSTGLMLTVIGIIGEYLRRLYLSTLNAPQYSVEEIIE